MLAQSIHYQSPNQDFLATQFRSPTLDPLLWVGRWAGAAIRPYGERINEEGFISALQPVASIWPEALKWNN